MLKIRFLIFWLLLASGKTKPILTNKSSNKPLKHSGIYQLAESISQQVKQSSGYGKRQIYGSEDSTQVPLGLGAYRTYPQPFTQHLFQKHQTHFGSGTYPAYLLDDPKIQLKYKNLLKFQSQSQIPLTTETNPPMKYVNPIYVHNQNQELSQALQNLDALKKAKETREQNYNLVKVPASPAFFDGLMGRFIPYRTSPLLQIDPNQLKTNSEAATGNGTPQLLRVNYGYPALYGNSGNINGNANVNLKDNVNQIGKVQPQTQLSGEEPLLRVFPKKLFEPYYHKTNYSNLHNGVEHQAKQANLESAMAKPNQDQPFYVQIPLHPLERPRKVIRVVKKVIDFRKNPIVVPDYDDY